MGLGSSHGRLFQTLSSAVPFTLPQEDQGVGMRLTLRIPSDPMVLASVYVWCLSIVAAALLLVKASL